MTKPNNNKAETFKFGNRTSAINDMHRPVAITKRKKNAKIYERKLQYVFLPSMNNQWPVIIQMSTIEIDITKDMISAEV